MMLRGTTPAWLRGMFSRIAPRYDMTNTIISGGLVHAWRRTLARRVAAASADVVIDVACGTGRVIQDVSRYCQRANVRYLGIDFTEAMLRVGQKRLAPLSGRQALLLCVADALHLPCATTSCDAVTMMFGVRNFADAKVALAEAHRVLRPGGLLYVLEFSWPQQRIVRQLYSAYWRCLLPWIAWPLSGDRAAYRYLRDSVLAFRQQPGVESTLREVGFEAVQKKNLSGGIAALYEGRKPVRCVAL